MTHLLNVFPIANQQQFNLAYRLIELAVFQKEDVSSQSSALMRPLSNLASCSTQQPDSEDRVEQVGLEGKKA